MEEIRIPVNQINFSRQLFEILKNDVYSRVPDSMEAQSPPKTCSHSSPPEEPSEDPLDFHRTKISEIQLAKRTQQLTKQNSQLSSGKG